MSSISFIALVTAGSASSTWAQTAHDCGEIDLETTASVPPVDQSELRALQAQAEKDLNTLLSRTNTAPAPVPATPAPTIIVNTPKTELDVQALENLRLQLKSDLDKALENQRAAEAQPLVVSHTDPEVFQRLENLEALIRSLGTSQNQAAQQLALLQEEAEQAERMRLSQALQETLSAEIDQQRKERIQTAQKLNDALAKAAALEQERKNLIADADEKRQNAQKLHNRIASLSADLDAAKSALFQKSEQAEREAQAIQQEHGALVADLREQIKRVSDDAVSAENSRQAQEAKVKALEADLARLNGLLQEQEQNLSLTREALGNSQAEVAKRLSAEGALKERIRELGLRLEAAQNQLTEQRDQNAFDAKLDQSRSATIVSTLQSQLAQASSDALTAENQRRQLETEAQNLEAALKRLQDKFDAQIADLARAETQNAELKKATEKQAAEIETLKTQRKAQQAIASGTSAKHSAALKDAQTAKKQVEALRSQLLDLRQAFETALAEKVDLEEQLSQAKFLTEVAQAKTQETNDALSNALAELRETKAALDQVLVAKDADQSRFDTDRLGLLNDQDALRQRIISVQTQLDGSQAELQRHKTLLEETRLEAAQLRNRLSQSQEANATLITELGTTKAQAARAAKEAQTTIDWFTKRLNDTRTQLYALKAGASVPKHTENTCTTDTMKPSKDAQSDRPLQQVLKTIRLSSDVLFESGSAHLSKEGHKALHGLQDKLKAAVAAIPETSEWYLIVEGHADKTPIRFSKHKFETNWDLSMARAVSVAKALKNAKITPSDRLKAVAFGSSKPLKQGSDPQSLAENRRVELRLVSQP